MLLRAWLLWDPATRRLSHCQGHSQGSSLQSDKSSHFLCIFWPSLGNRIFGILGSCEDMIPRCFRQHCHLTIWKWLVELTNSIRWQDPNNITDTGARCLVYLEVLIRTAQCTEAIKQKVTVTGQSCTMPIACCTVEKRRPSCVWVRRSAERYVNWITRCLSVSPRTINFTQENWIFTWTYTL